MTNQKYEIRFEKGSAVICSRPYDVNSRAVEENKRTLREKVMLLKTMSKLIDKLAGNGKYEEAQKIFHYHYELSKELR